MSAPLRIVLAQLNLLVGDIAGNVDKMCAAAGKARRDYSAHAIVFPELAISGYPPEDLLLRPSLLAAVEQGLARLSRASNDIDIVVGHPARRDGALVNAATVLRDGKPVATYAKRCLPNYGVFDEKRYFTAGRDVCVVPIQGVPVGITVCEDLWEGRPVDESVAAGARLVINLNASPYHLNKGQERLAVATRAAQRNRAALLYVNLVGGQDELVFDGDSFVVNAEGHVTHRAQAFAEELCLVEVDRNGPVPGRVARALPETESVYGALVLGVRDYIEKNKFTGAVLGLSGGVDSALTLCLAVDAIGAERVEAVMMPSRYTAPMSVEDSRLLTQSLGVRYREIPIDSLFDAFLTALKDEFKGLKPDATEENIQARVRGVLLMAISNKTGKIVLTTGNKSEMAVGYATLYGDMAGGFAAIKDVPKTLVYRLVQWRNTVTPVIPQRILDRPPSAELAPGQQDSDSLPPYATLDPILERYVERDQRPAEIVAAGFDADTVHRVVAMVDRNEYKRRQAAPGVRITPRAFGRDRRYPVTSGFGERPK